MRKKYYCVDCVSFTTKGRKYCNPCLIAKHRIVKPIITCRLCSKKVDTYKATQKYCSKYCRGQSYRGNGNPNYKDGRKSINKKIRDSREYLVWRESVFKRDNYTCVWCGQVGGKLNADHIKPFAYFPSLRLDVKNGRTLCKPCHKKTLSFGTSYLNNIKNILMEDYANRGYFAFDTIESPEMVFVLREGKITAILITELQEQMAERLKSYGAEVILSRGIDDLQERGY